jgi:hypothetical protein
MDKHKIMKFFQSNYEYKYAGLITPYDIDVVIGDFVEWAELFFREENKVIHS